MIAKLLTAAILIAALAAPASAADCVRANEDGAIAEGRLIVQDDAFILQMPEGICLKGEGEFDNVDETSELHVFGADDAVQEALAKLVGQDVHLRGRLLGAHTQHHKAPILMEAREAGAI
jgi:opacity protein-like surface antigen